MNLFASVEEILLLTFIDNLEVFAKLMNYDVIDNNNGRYAVVNLNLIDKISL